MQKLHTIYFGHSIFPSPTPPRYPPPTHSTSTSYYFSEKKKKPNFLKSTKK